MYPNININSFVEVDAREIKPGDIIDRGQQGIVLLRVVEDTFQTTVAIPVGGQAFVHVTSITYREIGKGALTTYRVSRGGKVRRLFK